MKTKLSVQTKLSVNLQLVQSTKILQMSTAELSEYIASETVANPVIDFNYLDSRYCSLDEYMDNSIYSALVQESSRIHTRRLEDKNEWIWNYAISKQESLADHLMEQLLNSKLSKEEHRIAYYITASLDKNGFVTEPPELIASVLNTTLSAVNRVLEKLKSLEPAGICASSLKECLLIQLKRINADTLTCTIAENHLELVAKRRYDLIAKTLGCTEQEASICCKTISLLDPKPGSLFFSGDPTIYVEPDVVVSKIGEDFVCTAAKAIPTISINEQYSGFIDKHNEEAISYLSNCVQQAKWLEHCVEQRRSSILKVTDAIVQLQNAFFKYGPDMLKPLNLSAVSELTGFHKSTVSRAVNNKYLLCKWGMFSLKYFFPSSASNTSNSGMTPNQVKMYITRMISSEDKANPLADQTISDMLIRSGVNISRRTVAKYRGELGIASSSARKYTYLHE